LLAKPSSTEQILHTVRKLYRSTDTAVWKRGGKEIVLVEEGMGESEFAAE